MQTALEKFIANYAPFTAGELTGIAGKFKSKKVRKNSYVLRQGNTCKDLVFVAKGCLRLYYLKDGVEISVWFSFAGSSAIEIHSFISGMPSEYFIQAIEDSEILYLPKNDLHKLYRQFPLMQEMMKRYWEDVALNLVERFTALQKDTAEKRYLSLLDKPAYMAAVPQKYLASFIGVTPTSLSRIRKQLQRRH